LKLYGQLILDEFKKKYSNARKAIDAWKAEISAAAWKSTHSVKSNFPSADFLHDNKIIFDIKGNQYRVVVKVDYLRQIVLVEWVGTHSEYSKKRF